MLFLVICQGIGLAAAVGIRPFLPALVAGALAAGNAGVDFGGTDFAFLEQAWFLALMVVGLVALTFAERRFGPERVERGPIGAAVAGIALGLGALLFAGSLADEHYLVWPGIVAGLLCAAVAQGATRDLFRRTRARLDAAAARALSAYGEGAGLVLAALAIALPPLGLIGFLFLVWLLITGRRRSGQKYAGLRVLR